MSGSSSITSVTRNNASYLLLGLGIGFLGGAYAVKWLKKSESSSSSSSSTFHIIHLQEGARPKTQTVTLSEFKRTVTFKDLNALRKSIRWGERTQEIWEKIFKRSTHIVAVKKGNEVIGYGCFVGNGRTGSVFDIHVAPLYQKHEKLKIGTLIMNDLVREIQKDDYASVILTAWKDNCTVLNFYKKFGFEPNPYAAESHSQNLKTVTLP